MKYLIINFYSSQNGGDLAILEQTVKLIGEVDKTARIRVAVADTALLPDIEGISWLPSWNWVVSGPGRVEAAKRLLQAYTNADVIVSLGGGYFFVHDHRLASTYATLSLLVALLARKPVLCFPQSFGPFRHRYQARVAAWLLRGVRTLMLREEESLSVMRRTDAALAAKAALVPDTAFTLALENPAGSFLDHPTEARSHEHPKVGITLLDWASVNPALTTQYRYEQSVAALIVHVCQTWNARVTLYVQCRSGRRDFESDVNITHRVAKLAAASAPSIAGAMTIRADLIAPASYVQAYREMDLFVGTRMHSLIFAACSGVPVIAIGYQHKTLGLMKMLRLDAYYTEMSELTAEQLIRTCSEGWAQRNELRAQIHQRAIALGAASRQAMWKALASAMPNSQPADPPGW